MKEAKVKITINTFEKFTIKSSPDHIWSQDYNNLICVLYEAENPEGEGDCQVIIIAESRQQIINAMLSSDFNAPKDKIEETLAIREDYESMCIDAGILDRLWAKQQREDDKYLFITPLELEALVPLTKDAAYQLFQIAMFKLEHEITEENARVLYEVTKNCEGFYL